MAISGPYSVDSGTQFPYGLALVSEFTKALEWEEGKNREDRRQDRDRDTGLPLWECTLLDLDPTQMYDKTFVVKIAADVQPVAPAVAPGAPLHLVRLEGMRIAVRTKVTGKDWKTGKEKVSIVQYVTATGIAPVKQAVVDASKAS